MTSVSGNKERSSRNRKHTMTDCSPTKSASFSPDSWYRKACEESRSGFRPVPEGARSVPGSSGAPSPGSGTSSPGSFTSSPGTVSPGIGTSSPGSLGGSPGFGTGSPASGSGSSPGSERGTWCDTCTSRLAELKRQAAKLLLPGPYSSKVAFKTHLYLVIAAQKLNLSSKKKKQKPTPTAPLTTPLFPTNFSGILQVTSPPAPPCLLRAVSKVRDNPGLGKVTII
ncbi:kinesin-like protein KIF26B [Tachysurus fulvidraco]|uniref:kinesin-like protein KIF26B n=1 Tax=Tachysurus fulvidraco TaxID=1234273 RepID=UPI001FEEF184|nr:kinesin-like protein KIF26B [Tachysurus fulvidraco]